MEQLKAVGKAIKNSPRTIRRKFAHADHQRELRPRGMPARMLQCLAVRLADKPSGLPAGKTTLAPPNLLLSVTQCTRD